MKHKNGHVSHHYREAFSLAIEAFTEWKHGEDEPEVACEFGYEPRLVPISQVCGMLWNCTDIVSRDVFGLLIDEGLSITRHTYAACAQAMLCAIRSRI